MYHFSSLKLTEAGPPIKDISVPPNISDRGPMEAILQSAKVLRIDRLFLRLKDLKEHRGGEAERNFKEREG